MHIHSDLGELPATRCNPCELNQVWFNLIQNAIDAFGTSGNILVVALVGDRIAVVVVDDGPGILPSFRTRLFEPFATTKGPGKGTGLGLATSDQLVRRPGGKSRGRSPPVVRGSPSSSLAAAPDSPITTIGVLPRRTVQPRQSRHTS